MHEVRVSVPAKPDYLHILRAVSASVGARRDLSFDAIDDLRIAVDEAGAYLLGLKPGAERLSLQMKVSDEGVTATVCSEGATAEWPPTGSSDSLSWKVLSGLADEAAFEELDGFPAIRLLMRATSGA